MSNDESDSSVASSSHAESVDEVSDLFRKRVRGEVDHWRKLLDESPEDEAFHADGRYKCPMCPFKTFSRITHLPHHMVKYHAKALHGTVQTKTVLRLAQAWHNADQIQVKVDELVGQEPEAEPVRKLLHSSAMALASQLQRSPSWQTHGPKLAKVVTKLDKRVMLLLDAHDTRFIFKADAAPYHRISDRYVCTDQHLSYFLACLRHPQTKGAKERVCEMLKSRCGWLAYLLPQDASILTTLCEALLKHRAIQSMMTKCRRKADKRVIGIDASYKVLLSVLYQTPHGKKNEPIMPNRTNNCTQCSLFSAVIRF